MSRRKLIPFATVIAVIVGFSQCRTMGILPNTAPGRRLAELITVVNSGDYRGIRTYAEGNFAPELVDGALEAKIDSLMRVHAASQKLTVIGVLSTSRERVIAEVYNQLAETSQAFGVSVERRTPHLIDRWYRGPAPARSQEGLQAHTIESDVVQAMDEFMDRSAAVDVFSGTVLIGRGDAVLLQRAVGLAHRSPDVANTVDTRFNIASVGKLFTAVAIAQLVQQGSLSHGDTLRKHIRSEWVSSEVASEIRIEHLLTHRSGLGDFLESEAMRQAAGPPRSLADYRAAIRSEQPQFKPGTRFQYSNSGFILLGAVIEDITKLSFDEYLRQSVFMPAGMVGTSSQPTDRTALAAPAFAIGYTSHYSAEGRTWRDNTSRLTNTAPSPAGGQFASAQDLWRFALALRTGVLVNGSTWEALTSPAAVEGGPAWGYGFEVTDLRRERRVGHGGSHEGIGAVLDIYLESGFVLVVLSNSDRSAFALREKFASLVME